MYSKRLCVFDPFLRKRDQFYAFAVLLTSAEGTASWISFTSSLKLNWKQILKIKSTISQLLKYVYM